MKSLKETLEKMGLTPRQSIVYLTSLKYGPLGVSELALKSGERKSTAFDAAQSLVQGGFLVESQKGKRRVYVAENPRVIENHYEERLKKFKKALPLFDALKTQNDNQNVYIKYYSGKGEIKMIFEDMLNSKKHLYWSSIKDVHEVLGHSYYRRWAQRRIKRGIAVRGLRPKKGEVSDPLFKNQGEKHLREFRYLPDNFLSGGSIALYAERVAFISTSEELFGFVVESKDFYNMMESIFDIMWKSTK